MIFIFLVTFSSFASCLNNTEPVKHSRKPFNFSSEEHIPSLFDSKCAYKEVKGDITNEDCYDIQYNNEYVLEILLPTDSADGKAKYIIPFIIDPSQSETTFSLKAQQVLGMTRDNENFNILYKTVTVKRGEENILGLYFLDETMMALDFYYREVGIHFTSNNEEYELNWPLASFKDIKYEKTAGNLLKKYQKVKEEYEKRMETYKAQKEKLQELIDQRDLILAKLEEKKAELKSKIKGGSKKRRRTDL